MAKDKATETDKKPAGHKKLLKKEIATAGKGKLGRRVSAPKWLRAVGRYFAGSWQELREVRWPTRRATWGLTLAVLIFTAVIAALILGLDFGFEQLFKRIIL